MLKKILIITSLTLIFQSLGLKAESYSTYRATSVQLIEMDYQLAIKVKPIIRTFVSRFGHVATVKNSNYLILADTPRSIQVLKPMLVNLNASTFDQEAFRTKLNKQWYSRSTPELTTKVISLKNLKAKDITPAIHSLVSKIGKIKSDEMSNRIEITDFPDYLDDLEKLIKKLDS